ncbi:TraX family protein [Candidatus Enterococcus ferrettii]|uniref:TraX protein n=1 Tax=Candidatus Enterococcus ferrettii TaxID=2815324 RepID=A0ABV0EQT1_9ENTE|nr:TraX family protein [Enterococcus sp. 665A]MBO1339692.1 hypothetical protein [Enterococcus sp. 665A]
MSPIEYKKIKKLYNPIWIRKEVLILLNRNQLKITMLVVMTLDHIAPFITPELSTFFHALTRCVAVFFGYMLVEGFHYTRNQKTYIYRLYGWALLMFLGNTLLNHFSESSVQIHNNIFLTLAVGASLLYLITLIQTAISLQKKVLLSILFLLLLVSGLLTEGGIVVLPFILITYFTKGSWFKRDILYLVFALILLLLFDLPPILQSQTNREFWLNFGFNSSWLFISVIPILHLYNGEKGSSSPWTKHLFYIYYPLHLWGITFLARLLEFSTQS